MKRYVYQPAILVAFLLSCSAALPAGSQQPGDAIAPGNAALSPDSSQQPSTAPTASENNSKDSGRLDAGEQLAYGERLKEAGRLDIAEKAFLEALKSSDPEIQEKAKVCLEDLQRKKSFFDWLTRTILTQLETVFGVVAYILIALLLIALVRLFFHAKNWLAQRSETKQIQVTIVTSTAAEPYKGYFSQILKLMQRKMTYYYSADRAADAVRRHSAESGNGPLLTFSPEPRELAFVEALGGFLANIAPAGSGDALPALLSRFLVPELGYDFQVHTTCDLVKSRGHVLLTLKADGKLLDSWETTFGPGNTMDRFKDVTYWCLLRIKNYAPGG